MGMLPLLQATTSSVVTGCHWTTMRAERATVRALWLQQSYKGTALGDCGRLMQTPLVQGRVCPPPTPDCY
jgi:hypothetical protein